MPKRKVRLARPAAGVAQKIVTLAALGAGLVVVEAALVPGLAIIGAAVLAPRLGRALGRRLKSRLTPTKSKPVPAPAAAEDPKLKQALAKTVTFRIVVTGFDFSWNYVVIGELGAAAGLSTISLLAGPFFYFLHETLWNSFGAAGMRKLKAWRGVTDRPAPMPATAPKGRFTIDRALVKTITFRTSASLSEFSTNYVFVRDLTQAAQLSAFGLFAGPFIYLAHEKAWERWGGAQPTSVEPPKLPARA